MNNWKNYQGWSTNANGFLEPKGKSWANQNGGQSAWGGSGSWGNSAAVSMNEVTNAVDSFFGGGFKPSGASVQMPAASPMPTVGATVTPSDDIAVASASTWNGTVVNTAPASAYTPSASTCAPTAVSSCVPQVANTGACATCTTKNCATCTVANTATASAPSATTPPIKVTTKRKPFMQWLLGK